MQTWTDIASEIRDDLASGETLRIKRAEARLGVMADLNGDERPAECSAAIQLADLTGETTGEIETYREAMRKRFAFWRVPVR
jgi:hypothetical protein